MIIEQTQPHPDPVTRMASISDLFFNYDHPARDKLYAPPAERRSFTDEELHDALLADAKDFAATLDRATGLKLDPELLVTDYLNRE